MGIKKSNNVTVCSKITDLFENKNSKFMTPNSELKYGAKNLQTQLERITMSFYEIREK